MNPLEQFAIYNLINLKIFNVDISFTNSALFMLIALLLLVAIICIALRHQALIPSKAQASFEIIYDELSALIEDTIGQKYMDSYKGLIISIFSTIFVLNLIGTIPFSFPVTSHFAVTATFALIIFMTSVLTGFYLHGVRFLKIFLPSGIPTALMPLMMVIEFFSFFSRPMSLAIRLGANIIAGHIVLEVIASFILPIGLFGIFPFLFLTVLMGFEIFVAVLQAYVFTILSCIYISEAIKMH